MECGFGGNYQITQKFSLYGEYQYASFGDINTGQDSFTDGFKIDDIASHEVVIGVVTRCNTYNNVK
ncbi:hypothetical protein P4S73_26515 [Paraglaciecola sp. Hal342]